MIQGIFRSTKFLQKRIPFKLADIGEGISEVQIIQWYVKEGNQIKQFDKIAEVQSDKATVEITSRFEGTIAKLHYSLNDMAKVGEPLIDIETEGMKDDPVTVKPLDEKTQQTKQKERTETNLLPQLTMKRGKGQRITKEDIEKAMNVQPNEQFHEHKMNPVQKAMVRAMEESLKIPHFGYSDEYQMDNLMKLKNSFKVKISPLALIIKAIDLAVKDFSVVNSHLIDGKLMCSKRLNLGIAIDTPQGLMVPVLKNVNEIASIEEIASKMNELTDRARRNKLNKEDFEGATLTISNIGTIGGTYASPVIVPPQVCIGAIGKIRTVPYFKEGSEIVIPKQMACFSWSADHRAVDGATMARFSNRIKEIIEADPATTSLK